MAAGMNPSVFAVKEKMVDELEEEFIEKVKLFTFNVKTKMRAMPREAGMQVFEFALVFLTQTLPDLSRLDTAPDERVKINVEKPTKVNRKKLNKLTKTSKITPASTSLASASAAERQSSGPPESLSQISMFSVRAPCDSNEPCIWDMKLLPGDLVVLTDCLNESVKGYDLQAVVSLTALFARLLVT
ncbi:hypothetical protein RRG08_047463 [Elysia crispata]|uniref:Uncharacterized protein n=1 Tax=Elysia crispata TaxID=231223 RepID=A0AAE0YVY8_9GAST|nr:hypothetical protein RRG08_047463 [Elysia crispata]